MNLQSFFTEHILPELQIKNGKWTIMIVSLDHQIKFVNGNKLAFFLLKLDWGCQQKLVLWSFASLTSIACIYTWVCMAKTFFYIMSTVANRLNLNLFYIQLSYRYDIPENYFHFVLTFYSLSLSFSVDDHPVLKADSIKYIIIFRNMVSHLRIS